MLAIGPEAREVAEALYEPRQYSGGVQRAFQVPTRMPMSRNAVGITTVSLCLAGAAVRTQALREAFARAHGGKDATGLAQLRTWLDEQASSLNRVPRWLGGVVAEARGMRQALLEAYAAEARKRHEAEREAEKAIVEGMRRALG